jgi:hypothetical protein
LYVVKKSAPAGDHDGIPFYVKTAGCKREIVRLKPYYLLTLTSRTGDKTSQSESTAVCGENMTSADFQNLVNTARVGGNIGGLWNDVKKMSCTLTEQSPVGSKDWFVTSDTIASYTYVDYENPYTLNVRRPIMGTASATTKLAEDGTLSEGTAQVEDKTGETLLGAIPSSDLIKNAAGIAIAALAPTASYELKIEDKNVKFTWTYRDPATHGGCEKDASLVSDPPTVGKADLVIEDAAASEKKSVDDSNSVKVSGSIQLPKAKDPAPASGTNK